MNDRSDTEQLLGLWFRDGPTAMPDRVVNVVADRIARQPQRRAWRLRGGLFMTTYAKLAAGLAAVLVVAFVGWQLRPGGNFVGNPAATPSLGPTPTAVKAPSASACENDLPRCAGPLAAGAHSSNGFSPGFEFTTPPGWGNYVALETIYGLSTSLARPDPILVWSNVRPAQKTTACEVLGARGAGGVADWQTFLATNPGLLLSNGHTVDLNGAPAIVVDVAPDPKWISPCVDDRATHDVAIIKNDAEPAGDGYGVTDGSRVRLYLIALARETVVVTIYSYAGGDASFLAAVAEAEPIVQTFHWACRPTSPPGPCWGPPDASGNPATPPPTTAP